MKGLISDKDLIALVNAVHGALVKSIGNTSEPEPQLVANLVWHLPRLINSVSFQSGYSIKSGGVFVHAQPLVKCANFPESYPRSVEIGDLLLLRTGIQGGVVVDRRALLLQAKKIDKLPAMPDNKNQHHLYAQWPTFEYVRSGTELNGQKRYVKGLDLYNAAKYLLIGEGNLTCDFLCLGFSHIKDKCCALTAQPSQPSLTNYKCFLGELIDFILGESGKMYDVPPPKWKKQWDLVIKDLTTVTAKRASKIMKKAASGATVTRGRMLAFLSGGLPLTAVLSGAGVSFKDPKEGMEGPPDIPGQWLQDGDEGGISIIEFVVETEAVGHG